MNHCHYLQVMPGIHCLRCHTDYSEDKVAGITEIQEHEKTCPNSIPVTQCTPACGKNYKHKCPACGQDIYGV